MYRWLKGPVVKISVVKGSLAKIPVANGSLAKVAALKFLINKLGYFYVTAKIKVGDGLLGCKDVFRGLNRIINNQKKRKKNGAF